MHGKCGTRYAEEGGDRRRLHSVVIVVGEKVENVIVCDITLSQGRGEITLDRAHRISSIKLHHLEQLDTVTCESATKHANSGWGETNVSLSSLKWLQAVLKREAKVFCGRTLIVTLWASCRTSTYSLGSAVTSGSWDDDGIVSSFVGSALMVLIGRELSRRTVRHGQIAGVWS